MAKVALLPKRYADSQPRSLAAPSAMALAMGMRSFITASTAVDLVRRVRVTTTDSVQPTDLGLAYNSVKTTGGISIGAGNLNTVKGQNQDYSVLIKFFVPAAPTSTVYLMGDADNFASGSQLAVGVNSSLQITGQLSGYTIDPSITNLTVQIGWNTLVVGAAYNTRGASPFYNVYLTLNGKKFIGSGVSGNVFSGPNFSYFSYGDYAGISPPSGWLFLLGAVFARNISQSEIKAISDNPWRLVEPESRGSLATPLSASTSITQGRAILPRRYAEKQPAKFAKAADGFGTVFLTDSKFNDIVGGTPVALVGSATNPSIKAGAKGLEYVNTTTASTYGQYPVSSAATDLLSGTKSGTLHLYIKINTSSISSFFSKADYNAFGGWYIKIATNRFISFCSVGSNTDSVVIAGAALPANTYCLLSITHEYENGTTHRIKIYIDGVLNKNATYVDDGTHGSDASAPILLGGSTVMSATRSSIAMASLHAVAHSAALIQNLALNPWQLFESDAPRSYAAPLGQVAAVTTSPVRYIRDWENGSDVDPSAYWCEVNAFDGSGTSLGPTATYTFDGATTNPFNNPGIFYDNAQTGTNGYNVAGSGLHWVMMDLGSVKSVKSVQILRYPGATFHQTKTEVSPDGITWYPVFDSAVSGEYVEPSAGGVTRSVPIYTYTPSAANNLVAATTVQANAASTAAVTEVVGSVGATSVQANSTSTAAIVRIVPLTGATSVQGNTSNVGVETQVHTLVAATSVQSNSASTSVVTRVVPLQGATSVQSSGTSTGSVAVVVVLVGASSTQAANTTTAAVTAVKSLVGATTAQANSTSTGSLSASVNLVGATSVQANATATAAEAVTHVTVGAGSSQSNASSTSAVTRVVNLSTATTSQVNTSLATGITGAGTLQPATTTQGNSSSTSTIGLARTLSGAITTQDGSSGTAAVTKTIALVSAASTQASTSITSTVTQVQTLTGATAVQSASSGTGALLSIGTLSGATAIQDQQSSTGTVTLVKALTGATTAQAGTSTTGSVTVVQNLAGATSVQPNASLATAITSATVHNLSAVVTVTSNTTGTASVTQVQVLTGQASTESNASSGAVVSLVNILTGTTSVQGNTATTGLLAAVVDLVGTINTQGNTTPTQAIAQIQNLVAAAVNQGQVSGTGVMGQVRFLLGTPTTQSKTGGVGSIVVGALITIGEVTVRVDFDPYDVQVNSGKYAVSVSNEPYEVSVVTRRA